jgi:hypothetical protein
MTERVPTHVLVPCTMGDHSLRSLVDPAELARLREPVLGRALASTTPLCWGFCSLQDAMMLLLSPSRADPRFGLAPDEPFALGRVAGEVLWLDRSLRRPGPGSVETELGRESLRGAIFMHGAVLARPTGAGVVEVLTATEIWQRTTRELVRASFGRRAKRTLTNWPRTAAGWTELWERPASSEVFAALLHLEASLELGHVR